MDEYNSLDLKIVETRNYQSIDWQPMATAPRDGRRILLKCRNKRGENYVDIGRWDANPAFNWYDDNGYSTKPHGWLPLPPV